jgi:hypothetical protein
MRQYTFVTNGSCLLTTVVVPIEVVIRITITLVIKSVLLICGTVSERIVEICNVVEKVDLLFFQHQCSS